MKVEIRKKCPRCQGTGRDATETRWRFETKCCDCDGGWIITTGEVVSTSLTQGDKVITKMVMGD